MRNIDDEMIKVLPEFMYGNVFHPEIREKEMKSVHHYDGTIKCNHFHH